MSLFVLAAMFLMLVSTLSEQEGCGTLESRVAALESIVNVSTSDLTFLELTRDSWESFVYRLAQPTDKECYFNYSTGSCYPRCMWYAMLPYLHLSNLTPVGSNTSSAITLPQDRAGWSKRGQ